MNKKTTNNFISNQKKEKQSKPKSNKTAMIVLWVLFIFWTLSSILSVFVFTKTVVKAETSIPIVGYFADGSYNIWSSNLDLGTLVSNNADNQYDNSFNTVSIDGEYSHGEVYPKMRPADNTIINYFFHLNNYFDYNSNSYTTQRITIYAYYQYSIQNFIVRPLSGAQSVSNGASAYNENAILLDTSCLESFCYLYNPEYPAVRTLCRIIRSSADFTVDIYKMEMGNYVGTLDGIVVAHTNIDNAFHVGSEEYNFNYVKFYDVNDNYIEFAFPVHSGTGWQMQSYLNNRTIYYENAFTSSSLSDRIAYNSGFDVGYNDGYTKGIDNSFDVGYSAGFEDGWDEGIEATHEYTFLNLMGAVVDAPIRALFGYPDSSGNVSNGLLNFELLGINIANFIAGLLTIGLVIGIVRICLGKG